MVCTEQIYVNIIYFCTCEKVRTERMLTRLEIFHNIKMVSGWIYPSTKEVMKKNTGLKSIWLLKLNLRIRKYYREFTSL